MDLFTNTVIIALGLVAVAFAVYVAWGILCLMLLLLKDASIRARRKQKQEARQQHISRRTTRIMQLAAKELENKDVQFIVTQLAQVPYVDKMTPSAKENNKQRNKLLSELRTLVDNPEVRKVLYSGGFAL